LARVMRTVASWIAMRASVLLRTGVTAPPAALL
jgi:hypothetical protein